MSVFTNVAPILLGSSLALSGTLVSVPAAAGSSVDRARVVEVEPVYRTVGYEVPTEQCRLVEVPRAYESNRSRYHSYTGPIVGAIIGGAIGNAVGHNKTNKKVGTAVGVILGGTIGRDIQHRRERARYQTHTVAYETEEICETVYESRERMELDGYDVSYRYGGRIHTTRMEHDPGRYVRVRVQVTPV